MADMVTGDTNVFSHRQFRGTVQASVDRHILRKRLLRWRLDWDALPAPIYSRSVGGGIYEIPYIQLLRSDTKDVLGIVATAIKLYRTEKLFHRPSYWGGAL